MTLKTGVMMLKIQLCITGINTIVQYITVGNSYFNYCNITVFLTLVRIRGFFLNIYQTHVSGLFCI